MSYDDEEIVLFYKNGPLELEIKLDEECYNCHNNENDYVLNWSGMVKTAKTPKSKCEICNGKGYNLTSTGDALKKFIERWGENVDY